MYLIWLATPDAKHFGDFRLAEVRALLDLFGIDTDQLDSTLALVKSSFAPSLYSKAVSVHTDSRTVHMLSLDFRTTTSAMKSAIVRF